MSEQLQLSQWLQLAATPAKILRDIRRQLRRPHWPRPETLPLNTLAGPLKALLAPLPGGQLERTQHWLLEDPNRFFLTQSDADYPASLLDISRPPLVLFGVGRRELLLQPWVALVGSRRASRESQQDARWLATELVQQGWGICSGLAMGIDSRAHEAALHANGATLAVLGTGPDRHYPPRNRHLQQQIMHQGLILSEFGPGTPPKTEHFPSRNRIISGLSQAVVVVAAGLQSGSLITARLAAEQGREVLAVPGAMRDSGMAGCHKLLQEGARLITGAADIISELPPLIPVREPPRKQPSQDEQLSLANHPMLANVDFETTAFDQVVARAGLPVAQVMNQLVKLELEGLVQAVPGGYIRVRR